MDRVYKFMKGFSLQTILTLAAMLFGFSHHIDGKLSHLEDKIEMQSQRTDRLSEQQAQRTEAQAQRTDKLYEMFIDLLKSRNDTNRTP